MWNAKAYTDYPLFNEEVANFKDEELGAILSRFVTEFNLLWSQGATQQFIAESRPTITTT